MSFDILQEKLPNFRTLLNKLDAKYQEQALTDGLYKLSWFYGDPYVWAGFVSSYVLPHKGNLKEYIVTTLGLPLEDIDGDDLELVLRYLDMFCKCVAA